MTLCPAPARSASASDRRLVEPGIEIAGMHADQLLAAVAEAFAGLAVDVDHVELLVQQEKAVRRAVDEGAEARFARAQLLLRLTQRRDVLRDPEIAHRAPGFVPSHVGLAGHYAHRAVAMYHAVLQVVARTAAQGGVLASDTLPQSSGWMMVGRSLIHSA